ncbi:LOW QUALITY PROTEIN: sphingomyelin phosphodiesterase [Solea solea]|uniref:LOW QUALITY PROTEIN: sphingomyelin phosphodiesterase n=1 Tax=Solea solea TaxID=90069 RepID=UPI00272BBE9D|nr:LOW QUALITY PROTEIN: sphingomyelin phosphodiesterase [Solea solea]
MKVSTLQLLSCPVLLLLLLLLQLQQLQVSCVPAAQTHSQEPRLLFVEQLSRSQLGFNWRNVTCPLCKTVFAILDVALLSNANEEHVARAVGEACTRLHLAEEKVCRQIAELFRDDFIRALQRSLLWPTEACALLVGPSCGKFDIYAPWNITLPKVPKPPVTPPSPPKPGSPQSRVLFLTDVHLDKEYEPGSAADCKDPLCCRKNSSAPHWRRREAGYWGTYSKCDLPQWTLENLLENAARAGPWDWVYWTGDIPAHNVWAQTRTQQLSFFGHTHLDEFQMFYDEATMTRPLGVAFIAPSVTTYINLNPGYRVYYMDGNYRGSSRLVLDHETYILNLTEANSPGGSPAGPEPHPTWTLLYRATEAYGISTLFPSDYNRLVRTFINDDRVFGKFWYYRHKGHVSEPCMETCKTTMICFLLSGRYDELEQCDLLNGFEGHMAKAARNTLC